MNNNRIKELRNQQKITLEALSKSLGISKSALSRYENGDSEPKLETWQQLSFYFDVPVAYLMGLSNERFSINTLNWIGQYIDELQHKYGSVYSDNNIDVSHITSIVMDQCEAGNLNILGDEDKTKALIDNAILMDVENAGYTNSGSIEFFKNQLDNATRQLQLRYKNEPHENIDIDLLGDVFNETDKFKKNLDELKKKYPDDNKKDSQ